MEIQPIPSPPSSSSNTSPAAGANNPMQAWWESISKARSRVHSLSSLLPSPDSSIISSLADSDRPSLALLSSQLAYSSVSLHLSSSPSSGSSHDPLCNWLYDTLLSADTDLRLFPLSLLPLLSSLYLSRISSSSSSPSSLSGFEAVLLALYSSEAKSRAGKPLLVFVPDLSLPSLYHTPRPGAPTPPHPIHTGVLCPPLEPQLAVKSTKRAFIVAVALECYYRNISSMPSHSKLDFCQFVASWAGQDCPCRHELDQDDDALANSSSSSLECAEVGDEFKMIGRSPIVEEEESSPQIGHIESAVAIGVITDSPPTACRVLLPWELMQPILRILGHCLLGPQNAQEVRDAAAVAARAMYARATHEIIPQAILATRSLIRLDRSTRLAEKAAEAAAAVATSSTSNPNTPTKPKKPEILLVSK